MLALAFCPIAIAQEDHSAHQHGVAGLGTVEFPTSCNEGAQKLISQATARLHSFGYEEARITYQRAAKADPPWTRPSRSRPCPSP